jgi:WD40 repeat protein
VEIIKEEKKEEMVEIKEEEEEEGIAFIGDYEHTKKIKKKKINFSTLALYVSEVKFIFGKLVALNDNFIIYGLKLGKLRAINQKNANKSILKGHSKSITDIKFMPNNSNIFGKIFF